jgi:hypothetical protein
MTKPFLAALIAILTINSAVGECLHDGVVVTVKGKIAKHILILADGTKTTVPIIISETPICTYLDDPDQNPNKTIDVTRIQLIGKNPLYDARVEIKGILSTGNFTQYYAEQTAIQVTSGHKIAQDQNVAPAESNHNVSTTPSIRYAGGGGMTPEQLHCFYTVTIDQQAEGYRNSQVGPDMAYKIIANKTSVRYRGSSPQITDEIIKKLINQIYFDPKFSGSHNATFFDNARTECTRPSPKWNPLK